MGAQLTLFDALPVRAKAVARTKPPAPKQPDKAVEGRASWALGMRVQLPIAATIQGEKWMQYTMGTSGRVEAIDGDLVGVRIESPGHRFDGRLAVIRKTT